ncbi:unnamed protein product [Discula destructiva]
MAYYGDNGGANPRWGRDSGPPPPTNRQTHGGYPYGYYAQGLPHPQSLPIFSTPGPAMPVHNMPYAAHIPPPPAAVGAANPPVVDPSFPAGNMINSTGGVGCEPGYSMFFNGECTKIHVLRTGDTPPWLLPKSFTFPFHACHVPCNTTLGELMAGFGATNPDGRKNKVFEVIQGPDGTWYKGLCFTGDNSDAMGKTIKSVGWDESRNGRTKSVVYLYITKG